MLSYDAFLAAKQLAAPAAGFAVDPATLPVALFPWQRDIVVWALQRGRAALFADCGLGKTFMELAWGQAVARHTDRPVLILTPLAVAEQTVAEGVKFGVPVTLCENGADVSPGVNVTNYEKLHLFDLTVFAGIELDEASILKAFMGATKQALVAAFRATPYKLTATATPSPNDTTELGNQAEFLGLMEAGEMLTRWFYNDSKQAQHLRLKAHAAADFWRWVSSWAVALTSPADLRDPTTGQPYDATGYILPPLQIVPQCVPVDQRTDAGAYLFRLPVLSATEMHGEQRRTVVERAAQAAALVQGAPGPWVVWVNTNYEADAVAALLPAAVEIRGNESATAKTAKLRAFTAGQIDCLITKPTIAGFGLNWQHAHQAVFMLSYSFEQPYQALRRMWRFGQRQAVTAHLVFADTEQPMYESFVRKHTAHTTQQHALVAALQQHGLVLTGSPQIELSAPVREVAEGPDYTLTLGDCVAVTRDLPPDSVDLTLFSPPFSDLYMYTPDERDMGNCADDTHFFQHFSYLVPELWRVTRPGRLCVVHCKDLSRYKSKTGATGLRDFPGALIRAFEAAAIPGGGRWVYHSRVTIWRDPVQERARTNSQRLLYKQLREDASKSGVGLPDYLVVFRKWTLAEVAEATPVVHTTDAFPLEQWREWASPVWFDINPMDCLNELLAKEHPEEKHICPLQLGVIERCIELWSNRGECVFDPFAGLASSGYQALKMWRRFVGAELKRSYHRHGVKFLDLALVERAQLAMFPEPAPEPALVTAEVA